MIKQRSQGNQSPTATLSAGTGQVEVPMELLDSPAPTSPGPGEKSIPEPLIRAVVCVCCLLLCVEIIILGFIVKFSVSGNAPIDVYIYIGILILEGVILTCIKKMPFEKSLYNNILSNLYIPSFLLAGDRHYDKSSVGTNGFTPSLLFCHLFNFSTLPDFLGRQFQMQPRRHHANHCMWCYLLRWFLACCVSSFSGTVVLWKGDCGRAGENRIVAYYQRWHFTVVLAE